jgi:hypothetical protein
VGADAEHLTAHIEARLARRAPRAEQALNELALGS